MDEFKELRYFIKKPAKKGNYSLACYWLKDRRTAVYQKPEGLIKADFQSLNSQYRSGEIDERDAEFLQLVAQNLRNGIGVCQLYYTGFSHTGGTADILARYLSD